MKKTAILTDSSAYLTAEQIQQFDIHVLPIPIIWDNHEYQDMIDLKYDDFYNRLAITTDLPTTSTPSLGAFEAMINSLKNAGYEEVIGIFISKGISSFYNNAMNFISEISDIKITLFDTHTTCAGLGNMALLAGKLAYDSYDSEVIIPALTELRDSTEIRLIVDNLSFLQRTGRISNAAKIIGGFLNIKPIIGMDVKNDGSGKLDVIAKERTYNKALTHVISDLAKNRPTELGTRITVIDAHNLELNSKWQDKLIQEFPDAIIEKSIIGPVVGVHTGADAVAAFIAKDWQQLADKYSK